MVKLQIFHTGPLRNKVILSYIFDRIKTCQHQTLQLVSDVTEDIFQLADITKTHQRTFKGSLSANSNEKYLREGPGNWLCRRVHVSSSLMDEMVTDSQPLKTHMLPLALNQILPALPLSLSSLVLSPPSKYKE